MPNNVEPYGLYIHIPFCTKKCIYCAFYSLTKLSEIEVFVQSLIKEIKLRKLKINHIVKTIYIGGGTPSLLTYSQLSQIFEAIYENYNVAPEVEITMEFNPEDIEGKYISDISSLINRYSVGAQSFSDSDLVFLGRIHNSSRAIDAIKTVQDKGGDNLSIDFIFGLPTANAVIWHKNLEIFFDLKIPHLSAYALEVEEKTKLWANLRHKKIPQLSDKSSLDNYYTLVEEMKKKDYLHYEISSFTKGDYISQHNSSYWRGTKYLGFGPAAHSFDGDIRRWNISSLGGYVKALSENSKFYEYEKLSDMDKINEYIMTGLRTIWGIDMDVVKSKWSADIAKKLIKSLKKISTENIVSEGSVWTLTEQGMTLSDDIISDLFFID